MNDSSDFYSDLFSEIDSSFSDSDVDSNAESTSSTISKSTNDYKKDNNEDVERDYEEEKRKKKYIYNTLLKDYPIDIDIKAIISERIKNIDIRDLNYTILVSAMVILAKSGNKIDQRFSELSEEVIKNIVMSDPIIQKMNSQNIPGLKQDLLRYCRFILNE